MSVTFMFIETAQLHKAFNDNVILHDVSFTLAPKKRVGLVGDNGSGKSTLLKIILGEMAYDEGSLVVKKGVSISYIPQVSDIDKDQTVEDYLGDYTEKKYMIGQVLESLSAADITHKSCQMLSGGEKTKVYLARIALSDADVLLLDEPTNHLDLQGLKWLETYLKQYKGALVIVSHDRYFLDEVVTEIIEIEKGNLSVYGGNYSFYKEQKQIQKEAYLNLYQSQQKDVSRLKQIVKKQKEDGNSKNYNRVNERDNDKYSAHYHADRSSIKLHKSAKNIESRIGNIDMLEKPDKETVLDLYFKPSGAKNSNVVTIEHMDVGYEETLFTIEAFSILSGDTVALQGNNGSGKTTLVSRILDHDNYPEISVGPGVKIGYLSQDHNELSSYATALELFTEIDGIEITDAYKILSQINISAEQMRQDIADFSSGQKTKLLLAKIMASGSNCIILDEPTNHLDFHSIDIIEHALQEFKGTILCISHDRYFLENIGVNKYLSIEDNTLKRIQFNQLPDVLANNKVVGI